LTRFQYNAGDWTRLTICKGTSKQWLPWLSAKDRYDFIYIDGSHEAPDVLFDAVLAFETLRPRGLMCFDDYAWDREGLDGGVHAPKLAIDAFVTINKERLEIMHAGVQVWLMRVDG
jgi:predicted O-methyltransferase YrrM